MYRWRRLSEPQRKETLRIRRLRNHPMHSPPHDRTGNGVYLVTAACYEHTPLIGSSDTRMDFFSEALQECCHQCEGVTLEAWVVLPNHYHLLAASESCTMLLAGLGRLHGRSSRTWNIEEDKVGRKVWFNAVERKIDSDRHHITALQYVHHNPVKHGYCKKWQEWKWSSAGEYLKRIGKEEAERRWIEYPFLNFGRGWDD